MGTLVTSGGRRVPELELHPSLLIDRTTVIYGPSGTGKTVLVKNIMKQLQGHIDQVLIVAPTEPSNRSYDGFVDPSLIHYRMHMEDPEKGKKKKGGSEVQAALRFLETIYKRQEMMAAIYTRANDLRVLAALYARLPGESRREGDGYIASLERKRRRVVDSVGRQFAGDPGKRDQKVTEVNGKFEKMLMLLYKKYLTPQAGRLWRRRDLGEDERFSLHYLHFNPRLLLVFDDCASQLYPLEKKDVFQRLFYQNRHSFITVVLVCQDDSDLIPNLRKNVFISIFTEPIVCTSNFDRTSNRFSRATRALVAELVPEVFVGHRKLAYIREDSRRQHFYHLTCEYPRPFMFGSKALGELCAAVHSEKATMDKENPFYEKFRV